MKNIYLPIIFALISFKINAQTGINTIDSKSTLEIKEARTNAININTKTDGLIIPTVTRKELAEKLESVYNNLQIGTLVYVNNISGPISGPSENQVYNIQNTGFYYLNSDLVWANVESDFTNDAWVNNPTNNRIELGSNSSGGIRQNNSNVIITDKGLVGINNNTPTKRLDINASITNETNDYIKIKNLKEIDNTLNTTTLVIDNEGNVYKNDVENLNGQIMRIPIADISTQSAFSGQHPLRLDFNTTSISPACTNNNTVVCNTNFINTIKGVTQASLITNSTLSASTGTSNRTTDRVILPKGTYKIQIKLVGHYISQYENTSSAPGTTIAKLAIGNKEFSITNYSESTYGNTALTSILYSEIIRIPSTEQENLPDEQENRTVDFLIQALGRNFKLAPHSTVDGKKVIKSMILIERLR